MKSVTYITRGSEDNISRVDELITVLRRRTDTLTLFFDALEEKGYKHWVGKLQNEVDGIKGWLT